MSMDGHERDGDPVEDLEVPGEQARGVTGGVAAGDVTGDGAVALEGDPDRPIVVGKVPGLHRVPDVTLKRG
jgi:hypothetical protein